MVVPDASARAAWRYKAPDIVARDAVSAENLKCDASNAAANTATEAAKVLTMARPIDPAMAAREEDSERPRIMDPAIVAIEAAEDLEVFRPADPLMVAVAADKLLLLAIPVMLNVLLVAEVNPLAVACSV